MMMPSILNPGRLNLAPADSATSTPAAFSTLDFRNCAWSVSNHVGRSGGCLGNLPPDRHTWISRLSSNLHQRLHDWIRTCFEVVQLRPAIEISAAIVPEGFTDDSADHGPGWNSVLENHR
jgi:hypothetical protein